MIPLLLAKMLAPTVIAAGKNFLSGAFSQGGSQAMTPFSAIQGGAGYDELMSMAPNVLGQQQGAQQVAQQPRGLLSLQSGGQPPQLTQVQAEPMRLTSMGNLGGKYQRKFKGLLG